jgi:glucosamine--fructose-6-phosphate aminotransferase (isomerizing)
MLKEIHEQPDAVAETIGGRLSKSATSADLGVPPELLRQLESITIVGCGSSYHAALAGRDALEQWARVPVEVEIASEYRYRPPVAEARDLVIGITQSGETADTLAAMRLCRSRGAFVLALTNVPGSQATRDADGVLLTHAGLEVGVAATKTYVCQVVALWTLALRMAEARETLMPARRAQLEAEILRLPGTIERLLQCVEPKVRRIAERYSEAPFFLYLARGAGLPTCLEGALKLKEISYIPTDAYAAGEMKHGPIALLSPGTPVVCVATDAHVLGKTASNIAEVQARGAHVIAIAMEGHKQLAEQAEEILYVPQTDPLLASLVALVPLQLLAYEIARRRGLNVDQPRNLAKTVTVE